MFSSLAGLFTIHSFRDTTKRIRATGARSDFRRSSELARPAFNRLFNVWASVRKCGIVWSPLQKLSASFISLADFAQFHAFHAFHVLESRSLISHYWFHITSFKRLLPAGAKLLNLIPKNYFCIHIFLTVLFISFMCCCLTSSETLVNGINVSKILSIVSGVRILFLFAISFFISSLSLIHIWRCRRLLTCRSRWSPYH